MAEAKRRVWAMWIRETERWKWGQRQVPQEYESCCGMTLLYCGCLKRPPEIHVARSGIPKRSGFAKASQDTIDRHRNGIPTCSKRSLCMFLCEDWLRLSSAALQS